MTETTAPAPAPAPAPESHKTFVLVFPVPFNGETVKSVTLRRPKGREIRTMQNGKGSQIDRSFEMMASLADREVELFDDMDGGDIKKIDKWLEGVLGE